MLKTENIDALGFHPLSGNIMGSIPKIDIAKPKGDTDPRKKKHMKQQKVYGLLKLSIEKQYCGEYNSHWVTTLKNRVYRNDWMVGNDIIFKEEVSRAKVCWSYRREQKREIVVSALLYNWEEDAFCRASKDRCR